MSCSNSAAPTQAAPRTGVVWVGVSTKMYLGFSQSLSWLEDVRALAQAREADLRDGSIRIFVIPSLPVLESARRILSDTPVLLGAQTSGWGSGALTGEVSPEMLAELGVNLVEVGHAERRRDFGETDAVIARKTAAIQAAGMTPLLCVGEAGRALPEDAAAECLRQVRAATRDTIVGDPLLIAYEPVWAIGADEPAPAEHVNEVLRLLRAELGDGTPLIYGGSAGPGLLPQLGQGDGLFLGRFAHDAGNLAVVIDEAVERAVSVPRT